MQENEEKIFKGKILSAGIGFGSPVFLDLEKFSEENKISKNDIEEEVLKYKKALKQSKKQILQLKKNLSNDKLSITFDILNTHLQILNDPVINQAVENKIRNENKSIETIFHEIILDYKNKIKDPFFQEKAVDITDVFKRILSNVRSIKIDILKTFKSSSVIISNEIVPSDVFELDKRKISAFLSVSGSYESHAAILARSKNIPFLSKIDVEKLKNCKFSKMIVDANSGKIIVNPTEATFEKYKKLKKRFSENQDMSQKVINHKQCNFFANISNKNEIELVIDKNLSGIGLLRTEMFFLGNKKIPSEEMQFQTYKKIALKLKNLPLIIRLFDLGADKLFYHLSKTSSNSNFRGVSYLIRNVKILTHQIRAILRASSFGNIFLLIPFVTDIQEILLVKDIISQIQKEINLQINTLKIGSMIETPASIQIMDEIIKNVDFVSIGTNDLTRYFLNSEKLSSNQLHNSLFKVIKTAITTAKNNNKPLFLCGEIAVDEKIFNELINMGINNFSIGIQHLKLSRLKPKDSWFLAPGNPGSSPKL